MTTQGQVVEVRASRTRRRGRLVAAAMVAPAVLVVCGVYAYPALSTLAYSVSKIDLSPRFRIEGFVWLKNFINQLTDPHFWQATWITIYFGVMLCLVTVVLSFLIALLLNKTFFGRGLLRVTVLLPWAVPPVASGVLWVQMFHAEFGFLNGLIRAFGGEGGIIWLGGSTIALHSVLITEVWRWIPFATLFILAGLQIVPKSVREAAAIDGAGSWRGFRHVTFPLMLPVSITAILIRIIFKLKLADIIINVTAGGPGGATDSVTSFIFREYRDRSNVGYGTLLAMVYLVLIIVFITLLRKLGRRWMRQSY